MEDGDDDRAVFIQPHDVVMLTAVDANAIRQPIKRFRPCVSATDGFATRLDLVKICFGLVKA